MNLCARLPAFILVMFLCGSCRKTPGPCTGNCEVIYFSGIAVDPGSQKPLEGLAVTVNMPRVQTCTLCGDYQVATGKTKADGTFALTTRVDTTKVVNRYCTITVQSSGSYITYALPTGPGIPADPYSHSRELVLEVDSTGAAPYSEFDFFQPVLLTVQLHRTSPILWSEPSLGLTFTIGASSMSAWGLNESPSNADTTMIVYTGSNLFTKVNAIQFITDSTTESQTDSIRCVAGGNNAIQISY